MPEDEAAEVDVIEVRLDVEELDQTANHSGIAVETHVRTHTQEKHSGPWHDFGAHGSFPVYACTACTPELPRTFWARLPKRVRWATTSPISCVATEPPVTQAHGRSAQPE